MNTEIRVLNRQYISGLLISVLCLFLLEQDVLAEEKGLLDIPIVETVITLDRVEQDVICASLSRWDWIKNDSNVIFAIRNAFVPPPAVVSTYDEFAHFLREEGQRAKGSTKWSQIDHSSFMEAIEDFLHKNKQIHEEAERFDNFMRHSKGRLRGNLTNFVFDLPNDCKNKVVLLSDHDLRELLSDRGPDRVKHRWEVLRKKYPKSPGIISVSRPGISRDQTVGILYQELVVGRFYVLMKKQNKWVMIDTFTGFSQMKCIIHMNGASP